MYKISIVMAYLNRKQQLLFTLKTISDTKYKNIEIIIVDDASNENERLEDIVNNYWFPIKLIRIEPKNKKHVNSCIAYNIGFSKAIGDIIIIQNPEVCHIGDVINYTNNNLKIGEYFSFMCANLKDINSNNEIYNLYSINNLIKIDNYINNLNNLLLNKKLNYYLWYNHPIYRPKYYHFLSCIYKSDLNKLNGFDERYANGISCDDDEFINRIKQNFKIKIIEKPYVIHQWHSKTHLKNLPHNKQIFYKHMNELNIKVSNINIEKQSKYISKKKKKK